tara:strand:- start:1606 stop:2436 length:831 start_codon:yes stop_codon:yes gene_type:complete
MWTNEYQPEKHKFQVLLSVYNGEQHLNRCLNSLNAVLNNYEWVLLYGDDGSKDDGLVELAKSARDLSCQKIHLYQFDKAKTIGQAKNRLIKEMHNFKKDYPYILFMDADDEMLPERPLMATTAESQNSQYVIGGWERARENDKNIFSSEKVLNDLSYGPWATLFHADFFTENEAFFPEDEGCNTGYEDILTWHHLKYIQKQEATPHQSGNPVHRYYIHDESACNTQNTSLLNSRRSTFWGVSNLIKNNKRNIYENPPSAQEKEVFSQEKNTRNPFD